MRDFTTHVLAVIDTLDFDQKQTLLRLVVEDVHVTGWHVQIRLRIPLDDGPDGQSRPPALHPIPMTPARCQPKTVCVPLVVTRRRCQRSRVRGETSRIRRSGAGAVCSVR